MGLLDKVKNLFTDEEIVEEEEETVKIREIKKEEPIVKEENKLPTFMREKIEKEEKALNPPQPDFNLKDEEPNVETHPRVISKIDINSNATVEKEESNKFKFPIDLEELDFTETRSSRQNALRSREENKVTREITKQDKKEITKNSEKKVSELYKDKKPDKKEIKKFKATPIISPVYGVLDKNYQADEVSQNTKDNFEIHRPSKNVDFDSVRKKAYGSLAEDIKENLMCENCEYLKEVKECRSKRSKDIQENNDNLMYDILNDAKEEQEDITLETATENYYDYGVEYDSSSINNSQYEYENYCENASIKSEASSEDIKINNYSEEITSKNHPKEVPPVKSKINLLSTLRKSAGEEINIPDSEVTNEIKEEKNNKNLELTDDLFSLIDSMYEERND